MTVTLLQGDSLEIMKSMEAGSVDAIVTDPPYGLKFMGKDWDHGIPGVPYWEEALRVAKPGTWLLAFGGTRTSHRLTCAIEDAGWEIRDTIMWVYGSGFPKSHNVGKAIDKMKGAEREVVGKSSTLLQQKDAPNSYTGGWTDKSGIGKYVPVTAPATPEAQQWEGWGTALKPAWEPIIVARRPLIGSVAENVLQYGTGAINIDGCRVEAPEGITSGGNFTQKHADNANGEWGMKPQGRAQEHPAGRWPSNLVHDGSDEVLALFPQTTSGATKKNIPAYEGDSATGFLRGISNPNNQHGDSGSAARFFYCAKASKKDRDEGLDGFEK